MIYAPGKPLFSFRINYQSIEFEVVAVGMGCERARVYAWVNGAATLRGSHVNGFKAALKLVNWDPHAIFIHVIMSDPCFAGPMADKLDVPFVAESVADCLRAPLQAFVSEYQEQCSYRLNFEPIAPDPLELAYLDLNL